MSNPKSTIREYLKNADKSRHRGGRPCVCCSYKHSAELNGLLKEYAKTRSRDGTLPPMSTFVNAVVLGKGSKISPRVSAQTVVAHARKHLNLNV